MPDDKKLTDVIAGLPLWAKVAGGMWIVAAGLNALYDLGHLLGSFFARL